MDYVKRDLQHIWHPCSQMKDYEDMPPIIIERGEGIYLYDVDNKRYADVISSWWCNLLGHNNKRINSAIVEQLKKIEHLIFCNFSHLPAIELAERLAAIVPKGICKFNFTDNGSSAIDAAMKMSFQYHLQKTGKARNRFMALTGAYHGETVGALSVCGCGTYSDLYKPMLLDILKVEAPDCYRCKFSQSRSSCNAECFIHAEKTFERYGDDTAAFLIEPLLQGAAGMRIYPAVYLKKLRAFCDRYGVLLIADEIATGFGRTGKLFACDHAEISPDIICISKGLTGGYLPMAIICTTQNIYDAFYADFREGKAFLHSHTYSGNPLACAAAIATIDSLKDDDIIAKAAKKAKYFTSLIKDRVLSSKNVGEIRSIGLINAIEIVKDKNSKTAFDQTQRYGRQIYKKALENGVMLKPLGDVIYFNPPLTITEDEMKDAVDRSADAILSVMNSI